MNPEEEEEHKAKQEVEGRQCKAANTTPDNGQRKQVRPEPARETLSRGGKKVTRTSRPIRQNQSERRDRLNKSRTKQFYGNLSLIFVPLPCFSFSLLWLNQAVGCLDVLSSLGSHW